MLSNVATQENRAAREQGNVREQLNRWVKPRVGIVETKDAYLLEAEMPGVSREGLEVLLEGSDLTIVGHRKSELGEAQLVYRELCDRDFRRSFRLDASIDTQRISARMDNGVLHLQLPKAQEVKPRTITVG